jgi:hypothetical protein
LVEGVLGLAKDAFEHAVTVDGATAGGWVKAFDENT